MKKTDHCDAAPINDDGGEVCAALRFGHGEDTMPPSVILEVADPYYDREDSAPIAATKSPACRT